jgi:hypothetical protein
MRRGQNTFVAKEMSGADADLEFKNKYAEAKKLLKKLESALDKLAQQQKSEKLDWGAVGSMGKAVEDIKELIEFVEE